MIKTFSVTVKEVGNPNPLHPVYIGDEYTTLGFIAKYFGLHDSDVESYSVKVKCEPTLEEESALRIASERGLYSEVKEALKEGLDPEQALNEYNLF